MMIPKLPVLVTSLAALLLTGCVTPGSLPGNPLSVLGPNNSKPDDKSLMDRVYATQLMLCYAKSNLLLAYAEIEAAGGDKKKSEELKKQAEEALDFKSKIEESEKPESAKVTAATKKVEARQSLIEKIDRLPGGTHRAQVVTSFGNLQMALAYNRAAIEQAEKIVKNPPNFKDLADPRIGSLFKIVSGIPDEAEEQINLIGNYTKALTTNVKTKGLAMPTLEETKASMKKLSAKQIDDVKRRGEKNWPKGMDKEAVNKLTDETKNLINMMIDNFVFPSADGTST